MHTFTYPNSNSWAEGHYGFGCHRRAGSVKGSDQRNAALISPICTWPYIYITFQHSPAEDSRNLGQRGEKHKWGQAEQQEKKQKCWMKNWLIFVAELTSAFFKKCTWQIHMYSIWKDLSSLACQLLLCRILWKSTTNFLHLNRSPPKRQYKMVWEVRSSVCK